MFSHVPAGNELAVRAAALVGAPVVIHLDLSSESLLSGLMLVVTIAGRANGNVSIAFAGGVTSTTDTTPLGTDLAKAGVTANGQLLIPLNGALPPFIKITLTPAAGFDGTVKLGLRAANYTNAITVS